MLFFACLFPFLSNHILRKLELLLLSYIDPYANFTLLVRLYWSKVVFGCFHVDDMDKLYDKLWFQTKSGGGSQDALSDNFFLPELLHFCGRISQDFISWSFFSFLHIPKLRILISELSPDGAPRIFPYSYAAVCFEPRSVELHPGPFEGRFTDWATTPRLVYDLLYNCTNMNRH